MDKISALSKMAKAASLYDIPEPFLDALAVLPEIEDRYLARALTRWFRELAESRIPYSDPQLAASYLSVVEECLAQQASSDFDSYMLFMEWNRDPERQFYRPRRHVLFPLTQHLQDLFDGKLDFLSVSMPPRTGKSTMCIMFLTFVMGNYPDRANVMSGHSDKLTKAFHTEALSIISDVDTYRFVEVFPQAKLVYKSEADETIHLVHKSRFPSLTCRSIEGTLTGAVEVGKNALLYCDDLVSDREEALSVERMDKLYSAYLNQLKDRMNDGAKQLFVGTRWVPDDPIGRIEAEYEGDPRYRFVRFPALDGKPYQEWIPADEVRRYSKVIDRQGDKAKVLHEYGKSNFNYLYGLGFSTRYYEDMRSNLYAAGEGDSFDAKYMAAPRYINGLLFEKSTLRWFSKLPEGEPDAIIAACDTKDRGKDYASLPIAYQYGDDFYIVAAVCDNGIPEVVEPKILNALIENGVQLAMFESNQAGGRIADDMKKGCEEKGHPIDVRKKFSTANKETRILVDSLWVKTRCLFWEDAPDPDYATFIRLLTTYSSEGKNKHDDAPDSMSLLKRFIQSIEGAAVTPVKRRF